MPKIIKRMVSSLKGILSQSFRYASDVIFSGMVANRGKERERERERERNPKNRRSRSANERKRKVKSIRRLLSGARPSRSAAA